MKCDLNVAGPSVDVVEGSGVASGCLDLALFEITDMDYERVDPAVQR